MFLWGLHGLGLGWGDFPVHQPAGKGLGANRGLRGARLADPGGLPWQGILRARNPKEWQAGHQRGRWARAGLLEWAVGGGLLGRLASLPWVAGWGSLEGKLLFWAADGYTASFQAPWH